MVDNPSVCMVHNAGELSLVEYGCNEVVSMSNVNSMRPLH